MRPISGRCTRLITAFAGLVSVAVALISASARAATIAEITNFGANPSGIGMYLYTPANVVAKPPILVGVHACHGKGLDVCSTGNTFAQQAEKYGFLLICPSAISSDGCWDVHSTASLTHDGGGDASGIISMVKYVIQNKNGDADRVYAAGHSSGGMMTNVLLGSYPDIFKAGAAFAGVPFACFAQGSIDGLGWSSTCANGNVTMTGAQWGNLVRAAYPGFMGTRPRIQLWHGTTDAILAFHNFGEAIKQWTNVFGLSETPTSTENNALLTGWIRTRYADSAGVVQIEAIQETGQPHNLVVNGAEAIHFLGLDGSNPGPVPLPDAGVAVDASLDASPVSPDANADTLARADAAGGSGGASVTATGGSTAAGGPVGPGGAPSTGGAGGPVPAGGSPGTGVGESTGGSPTTGSSATGGSSRATGGAPGETPPAKGSSSGCSLAGATVEGSVLANPGRLQSLGFGLAGILSFMTICGRRRRSRR